MSDVNPKASQDEIVSALTARAMLLWGEAHTAKSRKNIEEAAGYIWKLAQDPVPVEEPPAGFLS